jgi:hypothetical protein
VGKILRYGEEQETRDYKAEERVREEIFARTVTVETCAKQKAAEAHNNNEARWRTSDGVHVEVEGTVDHVTNVMLDDRNSACSVRGSPGPNSTCIHHQGRHQPYYQARSVVLCIFSRLQTEYSFSGIDGQRAPVDTLRAAHCDRDRSESI